MDNLLIEARQKSAGAVYNNGDWNTTLSTPVIINDGDIVQVSQCFIDTVSEADEKINIDKDITLELTNIVYTTCFDATLIASFYDKADDPDTRGPNVDGKDYIWCNKIPINDPRCVGYRVVLQLDFTRQLDDDWGGGDVKIQYTDIENKTVYLSIYIPNGYTDAHYSPPVEFLAKNGSVIATDQSVWDDLNMSSTNFNNTGVKSSRAPDQDELIPRTFTQTIDIDKGQYTPNDMVDLLNDKMGINNNVNTDFTEAGAVSSTYLHTSDTAIIDPTPTTFKITIKDFKHLVSNGVNCQLHYSVEHDYIIGQQFQLEFLNPSTLFTTLVNDAGKTIADYTTPTFTIGNTAWDYPLAGEGEIDWDCGFTVSQDIDIDLTVNGGAGTYNVLTSEIAHDYTTFTRVDGQRAFSMNTTRYFIGSNQMTLAYDTNNSKFYWEYLHFPRYESGGSIISTIGQNGTTGEYFHNGKSGGVAWNNLRAYLRGDSSTSYDFWSAKLGFNVNNVCVNWSQTDVELATGTYHMPVMTDWANGVKTTSARPTLDALVEKTSPLQLDADLTQLKSINDLTTEIYADVATVQNNYLNYGYFYIEVQAGLQNTIVGSDELTRNISAVVSRYYSQGSYTSMEGNNNMVYQHMGEPLILKDVRIRLLNSDRQLSTDIGDDNTAFISVIRGQNVPKRIKA